MVKKLITLAAVCTVAAVPFAEAFAPLSSKIVSTASQSIPSSQLFMAEDGEVSINVWEYT